MHKIFRNAFVYKISFPNGKIYIGRWTGTFDRLLYRYSNSKNKRYVERAILKYGFSNCVIEIIEQYSNISNDDLNEKEIYWINKNNSTDLNIGYNIRKGGEVIVMDIASKNSISEKAKMRFSDKSNHPSYGLKRSKETCDKISKSLTGKYQKENNSHWVGYLDKDSLLNEINNGGTFISISGVLNTSQSVIERSLEFYFGTKSLKKVRDEFSLLDYNIFVELIKQSHTIRSFAKLGYSQKFLQRNLNHYFGTTSLPEVKKRLGMSRCFWQKFDSSILEKIIDEMNLNKFELLNKDKIYGWHDPLKIKCINGHIFDCTLGNWKKGNRCHKCFLDDRNHSKIEKLRKDLEKNGYKLLEVDAFTGKKSTYIKYVCPKGHTRQILWKGWENGQRCGECSTEYAQQKAREYQQKFKDNALQILEKEMILENYFLIPNQTYVNQRTKLKYVCSNGHQKELTWQSWKNGNRCVNCNHESKRNSTQTKQND